MADVGVKRPDCVGGGLSGPSYEVTPWSLGAIVPLSSSEIVIRITWVIVDTPAQARLSQISLSLINQNIHLSRDILFIIAGPFIGGRRLESQASGESGRRMMKMVSWNLIWAAYQGTRPRRWRSVRNKLMFSSCLSKRDKMIRLGPDCLRLSVSAARANKSWELEI